MSYLQINHGMQARLIFFRSFTVVCDSWVTAFFCVCWVVGKCHLWPYPLWPCYLLIIYFKTAALSSSLPIMPFLHAILQHPPVFKSNVWIMLHSQSSLLVRIIRFLDYSMRIFPSLDLCNHGQFLFGILDLVNRDRRYVSTVSKWFGNPKWHSVLGRNYYPGRR